jgi:hypothetical protein
MIAHGFAFNDFVGIVISKSKRISGLGAFKIDFANLWERLFLCHAETAKEKPVAPQLKSRKKSET